MSRLSEIKKIGEEFRAKKKGTSLLLEFEKHLELWKLLEERAEKAGLSKTSFVMAVIRLELRKGAKNG